MAGDSGTGQGAPPAFRAAALFRPRHVLLMAEAGLAGSDILVRNLARAGFHGTLSSIGPAPAPFAVHAGLDALPVAPELAVLNLSPDHLAAAMRGLAARGCAAAIVTGVAPDLAALCRQTGIRALGQGSFGLCVPAIGLDASLAQRAPGAGRLALVGQSSSIARAVLDWGAAAAIGFSHVIGVGGNAGTGFAAALDWLAQDPGTGAILLDLRHIRDRRRFVSAARAAARTRPVVAIAAGVGAGVGAGVAAGVAAGVGAGPGRAGVGDDQAMAVLEAALRRAGVVLVRGLGDLMAAAETLARAPSRARAGPGDRVAVVANGHGLARLAMAALRGEGLRPAVLSPEARAALGVLLPGAPGSTPCVLQPGAGPRLAEVAAALAVLPEVDAVVALHAPAPEPADQLAAAAMAAAAAAHRGAAPILVGWAGGSIAAPERLAMEAGGLAVFATPEAAMRGAAHLAQHRRNRAAAAELPPRAVLHLSPDRAAVRRILDATRAAARVELAELDALAVLAAYGLPVLPHRTAADAEAAADAAAALGWPVVLKRLARGLPHKSAAGGVALDLGSRGAVRAAARAMRARFAAEHPGVPFDGFLVQRQAGRAVELAMRLADDAVFGPWIGLAPGGAAAGLGATAIELPPLNRPLAAALVERSSVLPLLDGSRGRAPADLAALADALVRLGQLAVDWPIIASCDIDPLFVDGAGVLIADARLILREGDAAGVLAIAPYPAELAGSFTLPDGERLTVRPIRPEDAAAHLEAFARLRPEDVRFRFFAPLRELSPAVAARLTQIDYDREMAFVAVRARPGAPDATVGTARLIRGAASGMGGAEEGEFAVLVADEMKGRGLGRHLLERLIAWARANQLAAVQGQVLSDNLPMLGFVRALGFALRRVPGEDGVLEARLAL